MKNPVCYLCGQQIELGKETGDHVIPRLLLQRTQPKVKGFDYGGTLLTHPECNNEFGPETYGAKALELIAALYDPSCSHEYPHRDDPSVQLMSLNPDCIKSFTRRDLQFFKIIDVRSKPISDFLKLPFFAGKQPTNLKREALFTALAVLTKSAAALLVSRKLKCTPARWEILAVPYYVGDVGAFDFDDLFGFTQSFDIGIKVNMGQLETNDFLVIYRARRVVVFFLFKFSETLAGWSRMLCRFSGATRLSFSGTKLTELVHHGWQRI